MQNTNQLNYSWLPPIVKPIFLFVVFMEWTQLFQRANKHWLFEKKWWTARIFNCFVVFFLTTVLSFGYCLFCLFVFLYLFSGKWKRTFRAEESPFRLIACVQLWMRENWKERWCNVKGLRPYTRKQYGLKSFQKESNQILWFLRLKRPSFFGKIGRWRTRSLEAYCIHTGPAVILAI